MPLLETLEKFARALEVSLYQLFYEGKEPLKAPQQRRSRAGRDLWGSTGKDARMLGRFCRTLARMTERRRQHLFTLARALARRHQ